MIGLSVLPSDKSSKGIPNVWLSSLLQTPVSSGQHCSSTKEDLTGELEGLCVTATLTGRGVGELVVGRSVVATLTGRGVGDLLGEVLGLAVGLDDGFTLGVRVSISPLRKGLH